MVADYLNVDICNTNSVVRSYNRNSLFIINEKVVKRMKNLTNLSDVFLVCLFCIIVVEALAF